MLDAFVDTSLPSINELTSQKLHTEPALHQPSNTEVDTTIKSSESQSKFTFLLTKLIAHANQSEIRLGQMSLHSTLEVLIILEQISSSSQYTQGLLHSLGATDMIVELYCKSHEVYSRPIV